MDRLTLQKTDPPVDYQNLPAMSWWKGVLDGQAIAWATCHNKHRALISEPDHVISSNGEVSPSLKCTHECEFNEHVTLDDWEEE